MNKNRNEPLLRCQSGAILVPALAFSTLLIGLLQWNVDFAKGMKESERGQDEADAATFSTAVVAARSLNAIALANLSQLVGVSILQADEAMIDNLSRCLSTNMGVPPWDLCPPLARKYIDASDHFQRRIPTLVRASAAAAEQIASEAPDLMRLTVAEASAPVIATIPRLPVRRDSLELLCSKGMKFSLPLISAVSPEPLLSQGAFQNQPEPKVWPRPRSCPYAKVSPLVLQTPLGSGAEVRGVYIAKRDKRSAKAIQASISQAEFYSSWQWANRSDAPNFPRTQVIPEEVTFHMHWRARLRRVRIPEASPAMSDSGEHADSEPGHYNSEEPVRTWIDDELLPACHEQCEGSACNRCDELSSLAPILGGALH